MAQTYTNHKGIKSALSNPPGRGHTEYKDTNATGLKLRVYSTGLGKFVHAYKMKGQRTVYTLPDIELQANTKEREISTALNKARSVHAAQKAQIKTGVNPAIERNLQAQAINTMPTVEQFAQTYIELYAQSEKKSWKQDKRYLDAEIIPALGGLAMDAVKRAHIIALLDRKQRAGKLVTRNRLISLLSKFFNFAIERGIIDSNPVQGIKRTKETSKERVLSDDEIRFFWDATGENSRLSPSVRFALRLILITGQRPGEVAELHELQIEGDVWTIADPKNSRTHLVPLSEMALQVIEEAQLHNRNGLLFPNTKGVVMGKDILPKALERFKWPEEPATPHDLRRTLTTGISRLGFNRFIQDKVTNHTDNSVGGVYDRYDYMKEKRQALDAWSRKLSEVITGQTDSNVIQLRSA